MSQAIQVLRGARSLTGHRIDDTSFAMIEWNLATDNPVRGLPIIIVSIFLTFSTSCSLLKRHSPLGWNKCHI